MAAGDPSVENNYQAGPGAVFTPEVWNLVMASIAARLEARELLEASFEALLESGTQAALDVITVNVTPRLATLIEQIAALEAQLEDIIGRGTAPNSLQLDGRPPSFYRALGNATGILPVTKVSGVDALIAAAVASLVNGSPATLDTLKELSDALGGDANFAASVAAALGSKASQDANLSDLADKNAALGNLLGGTAGIALFKAISSSAARTIMQIDRFNRPRNLLLNPGFRVRQAPLPGGGAYADLTNTAAYVADGWSVAATLGTVRVQCEDYPTPSGSTNCLIVTSQVAAGAPGPSQFVHIYQRLDGNTLADARFGTTNAKPLVVHLRVKASTAGLYGVSFGSIFSIEHFWASSFTISPAEVAAEVVKTFVIPARTVGVWPTDTSRAAELRICLASGTTYTGTAGWNTANILTVPGQVNFCATAGATFRLMDVGLYVDHDETGIVPPFELKPYYDDLFDCQRHYRIISGVDMIRSVAGGPYAGGVCSLPISPRMRAEPAVDAQLVAGTYGIRADSIQRDLVSFRFDRGSGVGDYARFNVFLDARL